MLSFRPHQLAFFFLFHCLLLAIVPAYAVPVALKRQDSAATTVMTQTTTTTVAGEMTQTCVITLTPITDVNGNPAVRQVKTCTITKGAANNGSANGSNSSSGSSDSSDSSGSSSTSTTSTADANGSTSSAAAGGGGPSVNGVSTVARPSATATDSAASGVASGSTSGSGSSASTSAGSGSGGAAVSANGISSVVAPSAAATSGGSASTTPPGSAAEQQAAPSESTAFSVPGQKLQVLPIGLGVFAGISVIALIVVGLVTYERTKYRKAFRARKLAESGAGMGYGGMAQRS